ncbi:S8 family serine peptidase [Massilia sp. P8910]|uniref:S8 family peptidase n=1 Tax=Massilia antarctica TaxID=2765360 RepID=UPI001E4C1D0F|nr:S8 family serine peptidase [Massilia antarctica]MCE3604003.1 S8 family serine peptidase [Massilia antarctica]
MKLITQLPLMIFTLGVSLAHAQGPAASQASPFGVASANALPATLSLKQAQAALSAPAMRKTGSDHMERLLAQESNELLVMFKDEAPTRRVAAGGEAQQLALEQTAFKATRKGVRAGFAQGEVEFTREYDNLPMAVVRTRSRVALVKLLNHPNVSGVMSNAPVPPALAQSLPAIRHAEAMSTGLAGQGTTVVVLDDDADYTLPAFGSCVGPNAPAASCKVVEAVSMTGASYAMRRDSHGTNVAAIVSAVAPSAKLALLDITAPGTIAAQPSAMIAGIDWSLSNRARLNIVAVNLSYAIADKQCAWDAGTVMHAAFDRARMANVVVVVAAGNDKDPANVSYPACAANYSGSAVVVGATYSETGAFNYPSCSASNGNVQTVACFSNGGQHVSIFAPGVSIDVGAGLPYTGTSQAAPHVAGAVAVLRGSNAAYYDSYSDTISRLTRTGATAYDPRTGLSKPRLDLRASLESVFTGPPPK